MMKVKYFLLPLTIFLFVGISFAIPSTPGDWWGIVSIDSSNATSGAIVSAYVDGTWAANATVGSAASCSINNCSSYYLIHVSGANGSNVTFRVYGVNVSQAAQNWSIGDHNLNLNMTKLSNGNACTHSGGCTSGSCASDYDGVGQWCAASGSCVHDGTAYASAEAICSSTTALQTCTSGSWVSSTCSISCSSNACTSIPAGGSASGSSVEYIQTIQTISPSTPAIIIVAQTKTDALKVVEINLSVTETVSNTQVTVRESSSPSGSLSPTVDGLIYKYMDISSTIAANKIASAKIKFKVEKSWVVSNNIDENKVFLQRYVNNAWARLTTTMVSSDSSYYYYEADSPGFSTFVITGEKKTAVQSCPYACCVGQSGYADKSCASGFECKSNSCVEKTAEQACSTCPSCSDWSSCANNLSTRTCYKCSADTNYQCASYSESKECKTGVSADMTLVILIVVIIIVIIAGVIFYMKFV